MQSDLFKPLSLFFFYLFVQRATPHPSHSHSGSVTLPTRWEFCLDCQSVEPTVGLGIRNLLSRALIGGLLIVSQSDRRGGSLMSGSDVEGKLVNRGSSSILASHMLTCIYIHAI